MEGITGSRSLFYWLVPTWLALWALGLWIPAFRPLVSARSGPDRHVCLWYLPLLLQPSSTLLNDLIGCWAPAMWPTSNENKALVPWAERLYPELSQPIPLPTVSRPISDLSLIFDHSLNLTSWGLEADTDPLVPVLGSKCNCTLCIYHSSLPYFFWYQNLPTQTRTPLWCQLGEPQFKKEKGRISPYPQLMSLVSPTCAVWACPPWLHWSDPFTQPGHFYSFGRHKDLELNKRKCLDVH